MEFKKEGLHMATRDTFNVELTAVEAQELLTLLRDNDVRGYGSMALERCYAIIKRAMSITDETKRAKMTIPSTLTVNDVPVLPLTEEADEQRSGVSKLLEATGFADETGGCQGTCANCGLFKAPCSVSNDPIDW